MRVLALLLALSSFALAQTPQQEKSLMFYERQIAEAERKHDWEAIARRLAPDYFEFSPAGIVINTQQAAEMFKDVRIESYKISAMRVQWLSPTSAIVCYRVDSIGSYKGQRAKTAMLISAAWARVKGAWMAKFRQGTVIPM